MTGNHNLLNLTDNCRLCAGHLNDCLASFGPIPVAGTYTSPSDTETQLQFPLTLMRCPSCGFVQLREFLSPSFYQQYRFMSGVAAGYRDHLTAISGDLAAAFPVGSAALEIGASDGTLLELLRKSGWRVAGFEPAREPSQLARRKGLPVITAFFGPETAPQCPLPSVDVVIIRHVLEHIDNFGPIFEGLEALVSANTMLVVEVPDLSSTVDTSIYNNIYHIHPCYFELTSMSRLLTRYAWEPRGSRIVNVFGGSLFLWAGRAGSPEEKRLTFAAVHGTTPRLVSVSELRTFAAGWQSSAAATRRFFDKLRDAGAKVSGYGAAERTTALLGTAGIDSSHLQVIYDRNPALEGLAIPGSGIPIRNPRRILEDKPDYLVVFSRSFEEEIIRDLADYRAAGGCFVSTRTIPPSLLPSGSNRPEPAAAREVT